MIEFKTYLTEGKSSSEDKLTHLEHAEDHPLNAGAAGFDHAKKTLMGVHDALSGKKSNVSVSTKYDGSPSIVFGRHPETGKFFVASKSAFNKNPKINYSEKDIDTNHGHAPGLATKLKAALKHLPKVTPKTGVYQGDIMHSGGKSKSNPDGDVTVHGGQANYTPNTITYSTKKPGEAAEASGSKIGVAVHTSYHGPSFDKLKAKFNTGQQGFGTHKDVHMMDVSHDASQSKLSSADSALFQDHLANAEEHHNALNKDGGYDAIGGEHSDHLKTYINKTVKTDEVPSAQGYKAHLKDVHQKLADKVSTPAKKAEKMSTGSDLMGHVDKNEQHFNHALAMHAYLQSAKNVLVRSLASHTDYGHTIGGKKVKPEGHVAVIGNRPTKLVDRAEFSKLNFAKNAK